MIHVQRNMKDIHIVVLSFFSFPSLVEKVVNSEEELSITSEKATKKAESVIVSTDEVSLDDYGESSQKDHDDPMPNTGELSIIIQINESNNNN